MKLIKLIHNNPSHSFSIVLLNSLMICFVVYLFTAELMNKYLNQNNYDSLFKIFRIESLLLLVLSLFSLYVKLRITVVMKKKIFLSELVYGMHETTIINKRIKETVSIHLDRKLGLKHLATLDIGKGLVKGRYVSNQTIDSILTIYNEIKTNPYYSNVDFIVGESHHIKHFKKTFSKMGVSVYPTLFSSNILFTFILMWIYNIKYYKNLMPNFKGIGLNYRFQIPIDWLDDPINLNKLAAMKRQ